MFGKMHVKVQLILKTFNDAINRWVKKRMFLLPKQTKDAVWLNRVLVERIAILEIYNFVSCQSVSTQS